MGKEDKVKREMEAFRRVLPELLKEHSGQWVVFLDGKVIDFYEDEESAYKAAMEEFGPGAGFVVARVAHEKEQPISFAVLFGVTHGCPKSPQEEPATVNVTGEP